VVKLDGEIFQFEKKNHDGTLERGNDKNGENYMDMIESGPQVIIVEDEPVLRDNLIIGLTACGFQVRGVADGASLDIAMSVQPADVVVLDLGVALQRHHLSGCLNLILRSSNR